MERLAVTSLVLAFAPSAFAADAPARVDDFAFAAGCWQAIAGDTTMEEQWSRPAGGVMLGTAPNGTPTVRVMQATTDGPASQDKIVHLGADTYVIPAPAMAYFGTNLDPSLFDVTALAKAGFGGRTPLVIRYETGTEPALPGVTITSASNGIAHGYVTPDSAKDFGAALADKAIADSGAGWPSSRTLFGSVTRIAPDMGIPTKVKPRFPMSTLIIDGISKTGGPMPFGFGLLMNMDDGRKFNGFVIMFHGQARASVTHTTWGR